MEIIRIGDKKMKLILDDGDMKRYGLTEAALSADTASGRRMLARILEEVGRRTGVETRNARTVLEAFPDKTGGVEIFLTVEAAPSSGAVLYRFSCFCDLSEAVKRVENDPAVREHSALYTIGCDTYVLSLPASDARSEKTDARYRFLSEYGERETSPIFSAYVHEYGTCLCPRDAIPYILAGKGSFSV